MVKKKNDSQNIEEMVFEYDNLRQRAKDIKTRMDYLAGTIKTYMNENVAPDTNGSHYSQNDAFIFGSQCRKTIVLNKERAINLFNELGIKKQVVKKVINVNEVIDEHIIESLFNEGVISAEQLDSIYEVAKTSYSIDIKKKEESKPQKEEDMYEIDTSKSTKSKRK